MPFSAHAIVNVESMIKKGEDKPFNVSTQLSYSEIDSRSTFRSFGAGLSLRYLTRLEKENGRMFFRDRYFGTFSTQRSKKDGVRVQDNQFYHLRYTRMLHRWFGLEALAQREEDLFNALERRQLFGAATRFDFELGDVKVVAGLGLLEEEEVVDLDTRFVTNTARVSSHMNFVIPVKKDLVELSFIVFYQPSVDEFSDFRLLMTTLLEIHLNKNLKFTFSYQTVQDSLPPVGIPKVTANTKHLITYSF